MVAVCAVEVLRALYDCSDGTYSLICRIIVC